MRMRYETGSRLYACVEECDAVRRYEQELGDGDEASKIEDVLTEEQRKRKRRVEKEREHSSKRHKDHYY
jgi:transcription-repair coupling factor (superfamily II helicase)